MRTGNPALNEKTFQQFHVPDTSVTMTLDGTVLKTGILLLLVVVAAAFSWGELAGGAPLAIPFLLGGLIGGLVFALVTIFKPAWSPLTAPLYAVFEGAFLCLLYTSDAADE